MFSLRIVSTSHYQAEPVPDLDVQYSTFRSTDVRKVPVLRIFGATPAGQKTCMHVHGVFPYLYVPYDGTQPADSYLRRFAASLDKAINVANSSQANTQHVFKISLVAGIPMYGYHAEEQQFLKIYLYNPSTVRKAADLLLGGAVMNKSFQPHEAHIPFPLQLFIDYNLYGMNLINVAAVKFRRKQQARTDNEKAGDTSFEDRGASGSPLSSRSIPGSSSSSTFNTPSNAHWDMENIPSDLLLPASVERQSVCELEVDVVAADILNRREVTDNMGKNPGLAAIWEDERQRRRDVGQPSQITPQQSQEHDHVETAASERELLERFTEILQQQQALRRSESEESEMSIEESTLSPEDVTCIPASQLEDHSQPLSQQGYSQGSLPSSQDTVVLEEEEEDVVISLESIQRVVSFSQSFSRTGSQPTSTPLEGEAAADRSLVDVLAALAEESSPVSSQRCAAQVEALEDEDSMVGQRVVLPPDPAALQQDEEETLHMSQTVPEDIDCHDVEGLDSTWNGSPDQQKEQCVMDSDEAENEDEDDDDIPQLDGASDKKSGSKKPGKKRLGVRGPVLAKLVADMREKGASPKREGGGLSADRVQTPLQSSCQPACDSPDGSSGHPHSPPATHNMVHSSTCQDPLSSSADSLVSALSQSGGGSSGGDMFGVSMTTSSSALKQPTGSSSSVPPNAASSCPGSASSSASSCLLPISHSSEDSGHKRRGESVSEQHPQKQASSRSPFSSTSSEVKVSSPVWMDQMSSSMMEVCGNNAECGSHQGRGSACSSGSASSSSHCVVRVERVDKWTHSKKLALSLNKMRRQSHLSTVTGPPPLPSTPGSSYSFIFHLPTPIFKRLKMRGIFTDRHQEEIKCIRMHPLDAQQNVHQKIGQEVVHVSRLSPDDLKDAGVAVVSRCMEDEGDVPEDHTWTEGHEGEVGISEPAIPTGSTSSSPIQGVVDTVRRSKHRRLMGPKCRRKQAGRSGQSSLSGTDTVGRQSELEMMEGVHTAVVVSAESGAAPTHTSMTAATCTGAAVSLASDNSRKAVCKQQGGVTLMDLKEGGDSTDSCWHGNHSPPAGNCKTDVSHCASSPSMLDASSSEQLPVTSWSSCDRSSLLPSVPVPVSSSSWSQSPSSPVPSCSSNKGSRGLYDSQLSPQDMWSSSPEMSGPVHSGPAHGSYQHRQSNSLSVTVDLPGSGSCHSSHTGACSQQGALPSAVIHLAPVSPFPHHHHHPVSPHHGQHSPRCSPGRDQHSPSQMSQSPQDDHCSLGQQSSHALQQDSPDGHQLSASGAAITGTCENKGVGHVPNSPTQALLYSLGHHGTNIEPDKLSNNKIAVELTDINGKPDGDAKCHIQESGFPLDINSEDDFCGKSQKTSQGRTSRKNVNSKVPIELKDLPPVPAVRQSSVQLWCLGDTDSDSDIEDSEESSDDYCPTSRAQKKRGKRKGSKQLNKSGNKRTKLSLVSNGTHSNSKHAGHDMEKKHGYKRQQSKNGKTKGKVKKEQLIEGVHYIVVGKFKGHRVMLVKLERVKVAPSESVKVSDWQGKKAWSVLKTKPRLLGPRCRRLANGTSASDPSLLHTPSKTGPANSSDSESDVSDPLDGNPASPLLSERKPRTSVDGEYHGSEKAIVENEGSQENGTVCTDALLQLNGTGNNKELEGQSESVNTMDFQWQQNIFNMQELQLQNGIVNTEELKEPNTIMNTKERQQQGGAVDTEELQLDSTVNCDESQQQNCPMNDKKLRLDCIVNAKKLQCQNGSMDNEDLSQQDSFVNRKELQQQDSSMSSEELQGQDRFVNKERNNSVDSEELKCPQNSMNSEELQQDNTVNCEKLQQNGCVNTEELQEQGGTVDEKLQEITVTTKDVEQTDTTSTSEGAQMQDKHEKSDRSQEITRNCRVQLWEVVARRRKQKKALSKISSLQSDLKPRPGKDADSGLEGTGENTAENLPTQDTGSGSHLSLVGESKSTDKRQVDRKRSASPLPCPSDEGESSQEGSAGAHPPSAMDVDTDSRMAASESTSHTQSPVLKTGKHCVDLPFTMSEHSQDADCSSLPQSNPESTSSSPAFPRMAMTCTDNKDKHEQPLTQAAPSARLTKEVCEGESQSPSPFCFQTVCDKVKEVGASQRALEASSDSSDSRDGVDEVHRKDHHKPQSLSFSWKDKLQLEDSVLTADMDKEKLKKQKKLTPNQRLGVAFLSKRRRKGRMKGSSIKGENGAGSSKVMDSLSLLHMATLASLGTSSGDHKYPCTPWRVVSRKAEEKENHDVCTLQHSAETNLQWKTFSSGKKEGKFDSVVVEDPSMVSPERGTGIHDGQTIEENMKMAEGSSDVQNLNHLHPLGTKDTGKVHRDKESDKSSEETDDYQISEFAESQFGEKLHAKTNAKRREISTENSNEDMCKESESKSDRELQEGENVTVNRKCKNRKPPVYEDSDEQTEDSDEKTDDYTMTVKMPAKRSTNRQAAGHRKRRIKRKTRRQRTESSKGKNKLFDSLDVLHMATLASLGADPTPAAHDDTLPRYSDSVWDHTDDFEESLSKMAYTSPVHSDLADLSPPLPLSPEDLSKVNVGRIQEQRAMPCRLKLDENWGTRNVCMAQVRAENAAERLSRRFAPLSFPSQQQSCQVNGTMKSLILGGTSPGLKRPSASVLASESAAQPGLAKSPSTSRDRNVCSRSVSTSSQSLQPTIPNPDKFPTPSIPWHHPLHVVTDCTDGRAWKERVIHDVMKEKFNSRSASLGDNTSPSLLPHSRDVPHAEDRLASVSSGSSSQSAVFLKTPPTPTGLQRESKRMHSSSSASMGSVVDRTSPRVLQSDATALRRLSASYGPLGEIHNQVGSRPLLFTSLAQRYAQRDRSSERVPSASDGGSGLYDRGGIKSPGILQPDVHNMNNVLLHRNELHGDPYGVSSPSSNQSIGGCHQWSGQSPSSSKEPERGLYCNVKSSPVSAFSHSSRTPPGGVRFHWSRSVDSVDSGEVRSLVDGDVRNHREGVMVTDRTAPASGSQLTPTSAKWLSDISNMNSASQTEKPSPANQHSLPASHHSPRISRTEMIISQMFNLESVSSAGKPVQASPGRSVDSLHGDRWPDGKLGMAKTVWRSLPEQETESHRDRLHNINLVKSPPSASWEQPPVCLATSLEYHLPSSHNSAAPCLPSRLNCGENMSACFSLATQKSPVVSKYIDSFRSSYNETIQPQVESSDKDKIGKSPSSVFCDKSLLAVNSQSAGWYKSTTSPVELSKIRSDQSRLTAAYQDSVACSPKSSRNYSSSLSTRWSEYSSENHSNFLLRSFSDSDQSKGDGKLGIGSSIQKTFYSPRSCSSNTGERNLSRVKETEPFNKDFCGSKSPIASSTTLAFNTFPSSTKSPGKGSPHSKYLENSRLNKTDVWPQQGRKRSIGDYLEEVIASAYGKVSPEEQPSSWSEAPRENCTYPVRSSQETDCTQVMTANGQTSSALDLTMCSGKVEESAVLSASGSMSAQTAIVSDVPVTCVASLSSVSSGYGTACLPSMLSTTYQTDASSVTTNTATVVSCTSSMPPVCSALVSTGRPTWTTIKTDDFENITDDEDEEVIPSSQDYSTSAYRFPGFRRLSNISSSWTPYSLPSQHRLPAVPKGSCQSSEDVDGRASMSETMLSSHSYGSSLYNYSKGLYSQCSSVSESSRMNREERICLAGKGQENYRDSGSDSLTQQPLREEQGIVSSLGTPWRASQSSTAAPTSSTHMSQFEPITDSEDEEERDKADITDPQGSLSSSHVRTSQFLAAMSSASFTGTSFFPSHTDKRTSSAYTPLSTSGLGLTSSSVYPHLCGKPMLSSSLLSQRDPARSSEFTGASDRSFATVSCPVDHPSSTNKDMDSTLGRSVVSNMADDRMHSSQLVCAEGGGDRHEGSEPEDGGGRKRKKGAGASPSDRPPSSNQGLHREDDSEKPEKSEDMGSGWRRRSPEEATGQQWMREKSGHVLCPRAPPPSREVVEASAVSVGLSVEPVLPTFCSHPPDLPDTARELGGRVLRLPTNMVRELEELPPPGEGRGLGVWQSLKVSESPLLSSQPHPSSSTSSSSSSLSQRLHAEPQLRFVLAGDGPCVITPVRPPPSCSQVTAWLQDVVQKMTPLSSKDHLPAEAVDRRRGEEEEGWGAEEVGDLSLPLDIDVPVEEEEEARLRDSGDEEDSMFTRLRDTPRELGEKASRKTAHSAESGEDMPHGSSTPKRQRRDSDSILHSTPVRRSSSDLFDVTCTPIGGGQRGEGSGAAQGKSTDPQFVTPKHPPLRRLSTNTQAALTKAMLTTDRRQQSFEGEISQIDAPTPKNAHGFKVTQQNLQDAKALHKHQFLTVLSMEVHADSRGDLLPDPEVDAIRVVFYAVFDDVPPERGRRNMAGVIVVDKESCPKAKAKGKGGGGRSSQPSTSTGRPAWGKQQLFEKCGVQEDLEVVYVPSELDLLQQFAQLIVRLDPDILLGFEVQQMSWGFLLQRAAQLSVNLCSQIARIHGSKQGNRFSAASDEWGADYTSEIHIEGRIVLNLWRLLRHEVTLNVYSYENCAFHILHRRVPAYTYRTLTSWYDHRTHLHAWRVVGHYAERVRGQLAMMDQLDLIGKTSEFARVFGIEFYDVLSRGSQYRVESMMLRLAKPLNFIPVSPSMQQRARQKAAECIPLTLEPRSLMYTDPVVVLDFQSLYPSIMIAYNYCFSTCLGRLEHLAHASEGPIEFGCTSLSVSPETLKKVRKHVTISPNGCVFVKGKVRRGVLPMMVEEILKTRLMVKKSMKDYKDDKMLHRMLDARQLGLKLIANVTYGYTGASFSGRMPCIEVADSIVRKARESLERAIQLVEDTAHWRAEVVYGDTDSLFIRFPGRSKDEAFVLGQEIADAVTNMFPKPMKLKFEKVYLPCALQTKKRYVGFMYETRDQREPVFDAKGIETVRRDNCGVVSKVLERCIKILFTQRDVSQVRAYLHRQLTKMLVGRVGLQDFVFAKEYRGMMGYKPGACVPALEIARKRLRMDRRAEPRVGERVPYVIVHGSPGLPLIQLVRQPRELLLDPSLRVNVTYYINKQVLPALDRLLSLVGVSVFQWYSDMPKVVRLTAPLVAPTSKQGTISQYFVTSDCLVCERQTKEAVCPSCRQDPQMVALTLATRCANFETVQHRLAQVCQTCMGVQDSTQPCVSLDCPVLFRRHLATLDLARADLHREALLKLTTF